MAIAATSGSRATEAIKPLANLTNLTNPPVEVVPPLIRPVLPEPQTPLAGAIRDAIGLSRALLPRDAAPDAAREDLAEARAFYAARAFAPLWMTADGPSDRARDAVAELRRAGDWGLDPAEFQPTVLDTIDSTLAGLARTELLLTGAVLKYARHARGGRIPSPESELSGFIDRKPQIVPPRVVLERISSATAPAAELRALHPQHRAFELLRQAYLAASTGAVSDEQRGVMPVTGPSLYPGKAHPDIAILRKRLKVEAAADQPIDLYDQTLALAVERFQGANDLKEDGIVGTKTRKALNGAIASVSADQLLANMEMWRWMPADLGATRVEVNVPDQTVRFYRDGRTVHTERVIVGKTETATPIFSHTMKTVVFQPKWGVPDSIKINELLPNLLAGNGLKRGLKMSLNGREVDPGNINWTKANITKYQVYQPSGEDNALGAVKFLFPNKHAVYLHDTPNKRLFGAGTRLFSHGCVRVRNPMRLAELILNADKGWDREQVQATSNDGPDDNAIKLDSPVPVHITYFTASVEEDLTVKTSPDVYEHEKRVTLALKGRFDRIVKLDPKPVDIKAVEARARAASARRVADGAGVRVNGQYPPPASLGYYRVEESSPLWFTPAAPSPKPSRGSQSRRFGGNSPNDVIMRSLGGLN